MLLASALSALCLSPLMAQITVTNATFPAAGDSLVFAIDNAPLGLNPATAPQAPNLDFSTLQKEDNQSSLPAGFSWQSIGELCRC